MSVKRHRGSHGRYAKRVSILGRIRSGTSKAAGHIGRGVGAAGRGVVRVAKHPISRSAYRSVGRGGRALAVGTGRAAGTIVRNVLYDIGTDIGHQILTGEAERRVKYRGQRYQYSGGSHKRRVGI